MFWLCLMNGAKGHTYGANGIWQVNRRGQPHGPSPTASSPPTGYGVIPWDEAMSLPGSTHMAHGKRFLESLPWVDLQPQPESAVWADAAAPQPLGDWIWYPEGDPKQDAPVAARHFRRQLVLPPTATVRRAALRITADDRFTAWLNGRDLGSGASWKTPVVLDVTAALQPGANLLAVRAENCQAPVTLNPAGLNARLTLELGDGTTLAVVTDAAWRASRTEVEGWRTVGFDDAAWPAALVTARYGEGPWGVLDQEEPLFAPQACGIGNRLRVVYVLASRAVVVRDLRPNATYQGTVFDPVTGERTPPAPLRTGAGGEVRLEPPAHGHDWVLLLELPAGTQAETEPKAGTVLQTEALAWHLDWSDGKLRSTAFQNRLTGRTVAMADAEELGLVLSAAVDRAQEPLRRVTDFRVVSADVARGSQASFRLQSATTGVEAVVHYELEGPTRRKWVEVTNGPAEALVLDLEVDAFAVDAGAAGGGHGQPLFIGDEAFAAIEHPSGEARFGEGRATLLHFPGRRLGPGERMASHTAVVSVAAAGEALPHFVSYVQARGLRGRRPAKTLAIYTPFGINNQWGPCSTLDDEQVLDVLDRLAAWQRAGVRFDYFTLDTGWVDPSSDLTRFRPTGFPNGPEAIVRRVQELGMKFGLWFATSWAAESCWDHPPAWAGQQPATMAYRNGYPARAEYPGSFCLACEAYATTLREAVLHQVRTNGVRFLKFDGGNYQCDNPAHAHLPGRYSTECMFETLIAIAEAARAVAPDVFVMWYWGLRSPFWALHGDSIFESGLHMEGSGTSSTPMLYYRDSVTLAQDQNAQFAKTIPPLVKDSLGVWLSDTRWGNYMGKERWREALVMDLGRGSLLFPNLWGNPYHLDDDDVAFLARMTRLAREHEPLFLRRRTILGDPWRGEVYGYAHADGDRGFLFLNNAHFAARPARLRLDATLGLNAAAGTRLSLTSHFPERQRLPGDGGKGFVAGDGIEIWLRPFEVLMLEIAPRARGLSRLPMRAVGEAEARELGVGLSLCPLDPAALWPVTFADAARFERQGLRQRAWAYSAELPPYRGDQTAILAVPVRLRRGEADWRYSPALAEIVQVTATIGDRHLQLVPVPDARQFGNTQKAGCSWVLYKVRLEPDATGKPLRLAVHAWLPEGVDAQAEAWLLRRWWHESARPMPDGYYADAPS
jgi:hypothetical protein